MYFRHIIILLILASTLSLFVSNFYYKNKINELTEQVYLEKTKQIKKRFKKEVEKNLEKPLL